MSGCQKLETQMPEIERADPQRVPDPRQNRRRLGRIPHEFDIALGGDERIKRVQENADRSREPHPLAHCSPSGRARARALIAIGRKAQTADE